MEQKGEVEEEGGAEARREKRGKESALSSLPFPPSLVCSFRFP